MYDKALKLRLKQDQVRPLLMKRLNVVGFGILLSLRRQRLGLGSVFKYSRVARLEAWIAIAIIVDHR